jgi:hypothetical protein
MDKLRTPIIPKKTHFDNNGLNGTLTLLDLFLNRTICIGFYFND